MDSLSTDEFGAAGILPTSDMGGGADAPSGPVTSVTGIGIMSTSASASFRSKD